jgi:sugar lactone lactonase YvrE
MLTFRCLGNLGCRRGIVLTLALGTVAWTPVSAQSNYSAPYSFSFLAGTPGSSGSIDATGAAARFDDPFGVAVDSSGNVYVADKQNDTIRKITSAGVVTTFAGLAGNIGTLDATGTAARFNEPVGVAVGSGGDVYVADTGNNSIRKITTAGVVSTLAGSAGSSPGSLDGTGTAALFSGPSGIAIDSTGTLYVTDTANNSIRKVTQAGVVTTLVGDPPNAGSTDGTTTGALFNQPIGIAIDSSGNLYVADSANDTIRKITSGGTTTTLAGLAGNPGSTDGTGALARFKNPRGLTIDSSGNLYVADTGNSTIRKVTPAGVVTTLAGVPQDFDSQAGTGPGALFDIPAGIAVDSNGNLFVADELGYTISKGTPATAAAPTLSLQPSSQTVASGHTVVFHVAASGLPAPTYQWELNGAPLANGGGVSGATGTTLVVTGAQPDNSGNYTCTVANASGTLQTVAASLNVVGTADPGRLTNISCRAQVGTGNQILITGFAVGGAGTTGSESLLIRASGPALETFDVSGTLADPSLALFSGATALGSNDGWNGNTQIINTAAAVGAFPWVNVSSHDAALLESLPSGPYTAQISGASGDTGVALAEIYDATPAGAYTPASPRLVNISARVEVGTDDNILIVGFVIGGSTSSTVLIRASGPALTAFGVTGSLADPLLDLYSGTSLLAYNFGWSGDPQIASAASAVGAFSWTNSASDDSAILVTLPPGAYTAQVSGASGDTGVALIEVYEVQ